MTTITEPIRWALAALALANIGIGLILIATTGLGASADLLRDIVGWLLISQAIHSALEAGYGKLHRAGEEVLVANAGLLAFAAFQVAATGDTPNVLGTWGQGVMVVAAGVGCVILWGHLTGRRLGREFRHAREARQNGRL